MNLLLVAGASAQSVAISPDTSVDEAYDQRLNTAYEAYYKEQRTVTPYFGKLIVELIKLVFTNLAKTSHVVKTSKNVVVTITQHALEEAINDKITAVMVDNLLSEVPSGMKAIRKFDDVVKNSRVIVDPNNNIVAIIDKYSNKVITIYRDSSTSIEDRPKSGRWVAFNWMFK